MTDTELIKIIAELAGLEDECRQCTDGSTHYGEEAPPEECFSCEGTGTGARFKSLRRDCPPDVPYMVDDIYAGQIACQECLGAQWLPAAPDEIDLGALLVDANLDVLPVKPMLGAIGIALEDTGTLDDVIGNLLRIIGGMLQSETSPVPHDVSEPTN